MDNFEPTPKKKFELRGSLLWNVLTVIALVGVCCLGGYFLSVFISPNSALNPFPPAIGPTELDFPTATWTPLQPPATWTTPACHDRTNADPEGHQHAHHNNGVLSEQFAVLPRSGM
jgi:hypothetical protein